MTDGSHVVFASSISTNGVDVSVHFAVEGAEEKKEDDKPMVRLSTCPPGLYELDQVEEEFKGDVKEVPMRVVGESSFELGNGMFDILCCVYFI